ILIVLLFLGTVVKFGLIPAFEYVNVVGIAVFLFCNHVPNETWRARLKPYSVDMLRIFTGLALITLGIFEKIVGAVLGQAFIAEYGWNFMPGLGFEWYTDQLFVLSAGAMEVIFGIIMVLGVVTRLNMLVISAFMLLSNVVFLIQAENENALIELVGHMPVIATAAILLLLGYGQRLKMSAPRFGARRTTVAAE
ncbi:MAG: DoxX family membrane protein, partial [Pseudomonadota bacterium]